MAKVRNDSLDIAKGIAIIPVVLAHTISPVMEGHRILHFLYIFIYGIILPIFFVTSGYLSTKLVTKPMSRLELTKQRAVRLLLPYFVWAVIYLPMKIVMSQHVRFSSEYKWYTILLGNNPDGQLWFLYVMFIVSLIMILFVTKKNLTVFTVVFMIASVFAPAIPYSIGFTSIALNFSLYQMGFFFLGTFFAMHFEYEKVTNNKLVFIISVAELIAYAVVLYIKDTKVWYLEAISATCLIYTILFVSNLLSKTKLNKALTYLGKKSMEIYILHAPLLVIGRIILPKVIANDYLYVLIMTVSVITLSILISIVINKIKIARLLLFGSK
ncbi:MAG: acyltransferase [Ruminococcaceae bacterium]|nr:acyltransferase [Oscillospiraceae bacterium]